MAALDDSEDFVRQKIEEGWSHSKLSTILKELNQVSKGFSVRSVQRFCTEKNIHKTSRLAAQEVDKVVSDAVAKVRSGYDVWGLLHGIHPPPILKNAPLEGP